MPSAGVCALCVCCRSEHGSVPWDRWPWAARQAHTESRMNVGSVGLGPPAPYSPISPTVPRHSCRLEGVGGRSSKVPRNLASFKIIGCLLK